MQCAQSWHAVYSAATIWKKKTKWRTKEQTADSFSNVNVMLTLCDNYEGYAF